MSFREKSAWVMGALMIAAGLYYWRMVGEASQAIGTTAPVAIVIGFVILVVINFVVITKGAGRIAEVGARFTLDATPFNRMR